MQQYEETAPNEPSSGEPTLLDGATNGIGGQRGDDDDVEEIPPPPRGGEKTTTNSKNRDGGGNGRRQDDTEEEEDDREPTNTNGMFSSLFIIKISKFFLYAFLVSTKLVLALIVKIFNKIDK